MKLDVKLAAGLAYLALHQRLLRPSGAQLEGILNEVETIVHDHSDGVRVLHNEIR